MDIPRPSNARKKIVRRTLYALLGAAVVAGITLGLRRLEPETPIVERTTLWTGVVKRGPMVRELRGSGTLEPERIWWIPAATDGRVETVLVQPGHTVEPGTVLVELSNPQLVRDATDAALEVKSLEAEHAALQVQLDNRLLDIQASLAAVEASLTEARLRADIDDELLKDGLVSVLDHKVSHLKAQELAKVYDIERQRVALRAASTKAELAAKQARLDQASALSGLRKEQVLSLQIRAGIAGVVEQLDVEVGRRVTAGQTLAKVSDPTTLKAVVQIPQAQVGEVAPGQPATIDTRSGVVKGRVVRTHPAVDQGLVAVDVRIEGPLPRGARAHMTVDGTIELEHLADVLSVTRPVVSSANTTLGFFRLDAGGGTATRIHVRLGRASVAVIEVLEGLAEGDEVVLSDTKPWDHVDRIRIR